jgi:SAM-dependent methyltransferase
MLEIPPALRRGTRRRDDEWEAKGLRLLDLIASTFGPLESMSVLDVGCGTRLAKVILDRDVAIGGYTGFDVSEEIIEFLSANVTDARMAFHHLDAHNEMYNPQGRPLDSFDRLPVGEFDAVSAFSVFTHLAPHDFAAMLRLTRRHVRPGGGMLFSLFIDDVDGFVDRDPERPLWQAAYSEAYARELIDGTGWAVEALHPPIRDLIQHHFVCRPA